MVCFASTSHAIPVERADEAEPGAGSDRPPAASGRTANSLGVMKNRSKFIALLLIQALLTAVHLVMSNQEPAALWSWHWLAAVIFGTGVIAYAFSIRCPVDGCRRAQVFRGWSVFDIRLPGERCYLCGTPLK